MTKTLSIDLDKEYRLKIESASEIQNSFFKDVYKQAFEQVENIVEWSNKTLQKSNTDTFSREFREYNNIIAFTGERGTGKSSAMLTVAKNLIESNTNYLILGSEESEQFHFDTYFSSLHTIDPSKFEKHQNIIEVILAELFDNFNTTIKNTSYQCNESEKRDLLKAFQDVYKCLKTISNSDQSKKYDGDALETLASLADATKLEKNIQELISKYLKFTTPEIKRTSRTLIIPIDDFDLNVKSAGQMAEQIRKYLMIPQVVVLMAINLEQFGDVKTQDIIGDFQMLLSRNSMSELPKDVAARYILKLIPIERRMIIPSIKIERNNLKLHLYKGDEIIIDSSNKHTFEKQIFDYLYINTGLYFVSIKDEFHTFLPSTLREFKTLCSVLGSFKKISPLEIIGEEENEELRQEKTQRNNIRFEIKHENLKLFENYFFNTWIKDYLLTPFQKMLLESSSILYSSWNKYFITSTVDILAKEGYNIDWSDAQIIDDNARRIRYQSFDGIESIINRRNYPSNVSLGDLNYFFSYLYRLYNHDKEIKRLYFSTNCLYSIKLNQLKPTRQYSEIKDIVNGTIVNKNHEIIRERDISNNETPFESQKNRIQFRLNSKDIYNKSNTFFSQNIFIKHDISYPKYRRYREIEGFVNKEIYDENFSNPTFNLFSFVSKDEEYIFPFPYNNLELWQHIIDGIEKDFKGKANEIVLVSNLFKQIWEKIKKMEEGIEGGMKESFLNHPMLKLFLDEKNEFKYIKYDDYMDIPDWFAEVYGISKELPINSVEEKQFIKNECIEIIKSSRRKTNENIFDEILKFIKNYNINSKYLSRFILETKDSEIFQLERTEFKHALINMLITNFNE